MEFKSNTLNQEVTQVCNLLMDVEMDVLADEIWDAFLSKDAHKLVNALNHVQQELMNGGASQSPAYQETRKLYLKCKDMLTNANNIHESNNANAFPSTNNQKYFTPQQAEKMGYRRPEYIDGSKPYEQWYNSKGQFIYVQHIDPAKEYWKNTGKSGFRIYESKTRKDMKQNKKTINEAQLRAIISEAVKSVLNEAWPDDSYGSIGDSASNGHSSFNDEDKLSFYLGSLKVIHKYEDGRYKVLVPPHFAHQMKELENNGVRFIGCDSDYTPMALSIDNEALKNKADDVLGQIDY